MREAQLLVTGNAALPEFKSMAVDTDSTVSRLLVNSRPFCEPFPLKTDPTTVQQYKRLLDSISGKLSPRQIPVGLGRTPYGGCIKCCYT